MQVLTEDSKMENEDVKIIENVPQDHSKDKNKRRSTFYINLNTSEKQDPMKPDDYIETDVISNVQQECTIFNGVIYLGAAAINAPKSEYEIQRNMNILNAEQSPNLEIKISVSVPSSSQGSV